MPDASASGNFSARGFKLQLDVVELSWSATTNTSVVSWALAMHQTNPADNSVWLDPTAVWRVSVNGNDASAAFSYDFRGYDDLLLGQGTVEVPHTPDGSMIIGFSASVDPGTIVGSASLSGDLTLTTIPRASTATIKNSSGDVVTTLVAGEAYSVVTNRASSSFTHEVRWTFQNGSSSYVSFSSASKSDFLTGTVTGVTLPARLPNAVSGSGFLTLRTYSGGTLIGTTITNFVLQIPNTATYQPSLTGVSFSDSVAAVEAAVGAFVQNQSKLSWSMTGAAAGSGATLSTRSITIGSWSGSGATGTMSSVVSSSGAVAWKVTLKDSRGRSKSFTGTVPVLAWEAPKITGIKVQRATSGGAVSSSGTYLKVTINASVSPLTVGGVDKNSISTRRTQSKLHNGPSWSTVKTTTLSGETTITSVAEVIGSGGYDPAVSYDVRVGIVDLFATSYSASKYVSTAAVTMHFSNTGIGRVGIGKYWEQGALDVLGDIYASAGLHAATLELTSPLAIAYGGTGRTSAPSLLVDLGSTTAASPLTAAPRPGVTGTLPMSRGGTGETGRAAALLALGVAGGLVNQSTDSSGEIVINHGLGGTPSGVSVVDGVSGGAVGTRLVTVVAVSSTQIRFRVYNGGSALGNNPVKFWWTAVR